MLRSASSEALHIVTIESHQFYSKSYKTPRGTPDSNMPGGLSRLMDKGRHHFNKTLSPADDAYLSCEPMTLNIAATILMLDRP